MTDLEEIDKCQTCLCANVCTYYNNLAHVGMYSEIIKVIPAIIECSFYLRGEARKR